MKIELHSSRILIDEELRQFVRRLVDFGLSRSSDDIEYVRVHVSGSDSPHGSGDKRCRVQVGLAEIPDVLVESRDADLYVAIHRALDRCGWIVSRKLAREHRLVVARMLGPTQLNDRRGRDRAA